MITELCPFDIHAHHLHFRHLIHFIFPSFAMSGESRESGYVDNWQSGNTVTECNLRMLDTEDFCDVTFLLGSEKQVVRAHRYVLVSRSCVFHAMFCGPLAEKGEVTIPEIAADIFKEFLRYVYTDKTTINTETVTGLMYTSRKYSLDALYDLCVTFLETSLSEDTVCQILEECHGYGELDLEQKALTILTEGGESVIKSPGFEGLCPDCLEKFLKSNTLNLKETDIFEAVVSWIKERCRKEGVSDTPENRRRLLGEMRYEIRFTSIPLEFLVKVVGRSGVLTNSERVQIIDRSVDSTVDISPFTTVQRMKSGVAQIQESYICKHVSRFPKMPDRHWYFPRSRHAISFSVTHSIHLKGCQLFREESNEDILLSIWVYDQNNTVVAAPLRNTLKSLQMNQKVTDVLFPESVLLQPSTTYTVCVDLSPGKYYNSVRGKKTVTSNGVQFTFSHSLLDTAGTSPRIGNIPGLIFSIPKQM
ncbi:BTB/POZ domain-containing protein 6-like isoform X1 [Haliotis rufescens]|uniref:BTB/POZ domain-containing protein 6-like isoform X1 n=2 Tax=Haliotis rufescens TaxID=6454 RepID=UPI00201ED239|nr:BTB/POZ domain-containing protein 6-like isoform X1 [Haliotis rufescens]